VHFWLKTTINVHSLLLPRAIPGGLRDSSGGFDDSSGGVDRFPLSLYNSAFCGGIVGLSPTVSPRVEVYSQGIFPAGLPYVYHLSDSYGQFLLVRS